MKEVYSIKSAFACLFASVMVALALPPPPAAAEPTPPPGPRGNPVEGKITWTCTGRVSNCDSPNSSDSMGCASATGTGSSKGAAVDAALADCDRQLSSAPNGPWSCAKFNGSCSSQ